MICNVSIDKTEAYNKTIKELKCTMERNEGIKTYEKEKSVERVSLYPYLFDYIGMYMYKV